MNNYIVINQNKLQIFAIIWVKFKTESMQKSTYLLYIPFISGFRIGKTNL